MPTILDGWNTEKVMVMAPDPATAKRGKKLAVPGKWLALGHDGASAWGEFKGSGKEPYHVKLDLLRLQNSGEGWGCTCPSRKQPCKHCLGLLFIVIDQPGALPVGEAPAYVQEWLDKTAQRARKQLAKKQSDAEKAVDPALREKTRREREHKIAAGLEELELWIANMIRHGLGDPQIRQYEFWDAKAARMVDAQAPGIAQWLRNMAGIPLREDQWVEPLLDQLGRLRLLIEGFQRFDALSEETQADIRMVLGWPLRREDVQADGGIFDHWLVLGRHEAELESKLRTQRLWLRGQDSGRDALILEFAYGDLPFDTYLWPGGMIEAELVFFPSGYPQRAFIQNQRGELQPGHAVAGITIREGITAYSRALARNPWLLYFPLLLDGVVPMRYAGGWVVREIDGAYLPVARRFPHKWSLLASGGGHPIQVAGEWDGREFLPTGAILAGRFVDFNLVGKL
jgi:hypothetical protein